MKFLVTFIIGVFKVILNKVNKVHRGSRGYSRTYSYPEH